MDEALLRAVVVAPHELLTAAEVGTAVIADAGVLPSDLAEVAVPIRLAPRPTPL